MKTLYTILILFLLSLAGNQVKAQDFVFTFTNPAFGGNPYNYSWLMESADKQNKYKGEEEADSDDLSDDPLTSFQTDLGYSIIGSLTDKIDQEIIGSNNSLTPGQYEVGNYNIRITERGSGLNVSITDQLTGNSTTMFIPNRSRTTN